MDIIYSAFIIIHYHIRWQFIKKKHFLFLLTVMEIYIRLISKIVFNEQVFEYDQIL